MKLLRGIMRGSSDQRYANSERALLRYLAWRGGRLFGQLSPGSRREFFCLDPYTWIWHEEWTDAEGKRRVLTTRYDVGVSGIFKSQGNNSAQRLTPAEERNFRHAAKLYLADSRRELQRLLHA
jgi:hypothetical protein